MIHKIKVTFLSLMILSCATQTYSWWYVYQQPAVVVYPAPVMYRDPSAGEAIATGVVALGAGLGLGISSILKHRAKKRQFKEYIETFRDMGYTREQSRIYAQMAMDNPEGLQAVVRSIDQERLARVQVIAQQESIKKSHDQKLQIQKVSHSQKLEEMSHEHKLTLLTYLVMLLTTIILLGIGFLLYRKR